MPKPLVTDEPWAVVEALLPKQPPKPKGVSTLAWTIAPCSWAFLFVLKKTAIPWEMLSQEMSCGSGMTCSGQCLKEWHEAEGWERLHKKGAH